MANQHAQTKKSSVDNGKSAGAGGTAGRKVALLDQSNWPHSAGSLLRKEYE